MTKAAGVHYATLLRTYFTLDIFLAFSEMWKSALSICNASLTVVSKNKQSKKTTAKVTTYFQRSS